MDERNRLREAGDLIADAMRAALTLAFVWFAAGIAVGTMMGWVALFGAPVPLPKPVKPVVVAPIVGVWESQWRAWGSKMGFRPDGSYYHLYPGPNGPGDYYVGTWRIADGNLYVTEQRSSNGVLGPERKWGVRLTQEAAGWSGQANGDYGSEIAWGLRSKE